MLKNRPAEPASPAKKKSMEIDMTEGPILSKLIRFILPLMLSGTLQLLYNAADVVVVGRYAGSTALAAVGSTGALSNLLINLMIGLSVGTSVITAQCYGARDNQGVSETVHTSMFLSVVGGILTGIMGFFLCRPLLHLMGSPDDVIDQAALYLRIIFVGLPFQMCYNFGAAILRAVGDTKRPLYFLTVSGVINICLNLFFVIVFHMGVAGVALATIASQAVSAVLVVLSLRKTEGAFRLYFDKLGINKDKFKRIIRVGLPAGAQSMVFSLSNVLIQSSVNSFGSIAMAGNAAAANIEGFVYNAQNSLYQASINFVGQNVGAKKYDRIGKITRTCMLTVTVVGFGLGMLSYIFGAPLLSIYDSDPEVIRYGLIRIGIFGVSYFTCGTMEVACGAMRGMGKGVTPMIVSLMGSCVLRIIWIYTIFQAYHTLEILYISYPVSWVITTAAHMACYFYCKNKLIKSQAQAA